MKVVTIGDSVAWGQGLLDAHKFSSIVNETLGGGVPPLMLAHSGATIGIRGATPLTAASGEVPTSSPTVLEQVMAAPDATATQVVLMNGGINDVNIRVILNPFTTFTDLSHKTNRYCHQDMLTLLKTTQRFTSPDTQFVVTGYYPVLSPDSAPLRVPLLLAINGVSFAPFTYHDMVFDKIVALCMQFWKESTECLQRAVHDCGDSRVSFADAGFTERNAVFASAPLLWGVKADFTPQDEVITGRHGACNLTYPNPIDVVDREACYRASAGHPNVAGARQFATAILAPLATA